MQISVAYAEPTQQTWLRIEVLDGTTVSEAIRQSGILANYPHVSLEERKVGIFGKVAKLDTPLRPGDRVEIYRTITCDPRTVPRRDGADDPDDE
jgi:putative ubiquitin-RnfH superfamily antitoxin RatB of RatAB toxin-antitoxin module